MIRKQMIIAICDDCGVADKFYYISDMSVLGWAIARNRVNCYCPKCAPLHRNTGCKGVKKNGLYFTNHFVRGDSDA